MKICVRGSAGLLLILIGQITFAQEESSGKVRPVQITFGFPLGTNGINSMDYANNFSLNILYGLNGGVLGAEMGSIINFNRGNVKGIQMSGVLDLNTGYTKGIQMAGVINLNSGGMEGIQLAGVSNINMSDAMGLQAAVANFVVGDFKGIQMGVLNFAGNLKGIQLGVVNVVGNADNGIPVGILSFVRNGHYELEVTGGEVMYLNLNYKMGIEKFYTIFKGGLTYFKQEPVYSFGLGFGGTFGISDKSKLSIDASGNQIVYKNDWTGMDQNLLNKLDINYKFGITPHFSLMIGPSFNLYLTEEIVDGEYGTLEIPYHLFSNVNSDSGIRIFGWVGLNAGLAYKF